MTGISGADTPPNFAASPRSVPSSSATSVPHATFADEEDGTALEAASAWFDDEEWDVPFGAARLGIP
jgi:hypothetical protein